MLSLGDDCCGYVFVFKVCARTVHVCSVYTHVLTETTLKSEGFCSLNLTFLLPLGWFKLCRKSDKSFVHKIPVLFTLAIFFKMLNLLYMLQVAHPVSTDK